MRAHGDRRGGQKSAWLPEVAGRLPGTRQIPALLRVAACGLGHATELHPWPSPTACGLDDTAHEPSSPTTPPLPDAPRSIQGLCRTRRLQPCIALSEAIDLDVITKTYGAPGLGLRVSWPRRPEAMIPGTLQVRPVDTPVLARASQPRPGQGSLPAQLCPSTNLLSSRGLLPGAATRWLVPRTDQAHHELRPLITMHPLTRRLTTPASSARLCLQVSTLTIFLVKVGSWRLEHGAGAHQLG